MGRSGKPDLRRKSADRLRDEACVEALRLYHQGEAPKAIAAKLGVTASFVKATVARVRAADAAESGEPAGLVRLAYTRGGGK